MKTAVLEQVMLGKEDLIDAEASAKILGVTVRRLHQKRNEHDEPRAAASSGRIVRYLKSEVVELVARDL